MRMLFFFCMILSLSSCMSIDVSGYVVPGETLVKDKHYYIVFANTDEHALHDILQKGISARGIPVSSGFEDRMPEEAGYLVEYGGQWQWDVTWYLLNFNVRVYNPENRLLIASASSLRTSLGRKTPEAVIAETLDKIFSD